MPSVLEKEVVKMKITVTALILLSFFAQSVGAKIVFQEKSEQAAIQVEQLAESLGVPWGMVFVGDDDILFTERSGSVGVLSLQSGKVTQVEGVPSVMAAGQGGLLDIAVAPGFKPGDWIYLTYVKNKGGEGVTMLARAKLKNNAFTQWQDIFVSHSGSDTTRHYGSRIAFDGEGHIFFGVGDRGERPSAQDLTSHNGAVLRLHLDGSIPKDNPLRDNKKALPAIWSYGHRNPQGLAFDTANARLWLNEHGPRGGDEINLVLPGRNYGWPEVSYGKEYWGPFQVGEGTEKEGIERPKKVYTPSIAPGSLLLYQGKVFSGWQGNLFSGALKLQHINRVTVNSAGELIAEERLLKDFGERIRALTEGPDGLIYFSTDSGKILRLTPAR